MHCLEIRMLLFSRIVTFFNRWLFCHKAFHVCSLIPVKAATPRKIAMAFFCEALCFAAHFKGNDSSLANDYVTKFARWFVEHQSRWRKPIVWRQSTFKFGGFEDLFDFSAIWLGKIFGVIWFESFFNGIKCSTAYTYVFWWKDGNWRGDRKQKEKS